MKLKQAHPERRYVFFDKNCAPYHASDVGWFFKAEAGRLVGGGMAHYVRQDREGNWIPTNDSGAINDNHEPDVEDGPVGDEEGTGAEATGATEPDAGPAAKKGGRQRRQRVKLD